MTRIIRYDDIEEGIIDDYLLIDLRSPSEYIDSTIPGAINIPLFNDEERAEVGTIYRQNSPEEAKRAGIKIVARKLPDMYDKIVKLSLQHKHLIFFCARGGMRSKCVSSFLEALNINALKLAGGYKAYRNHLLENLPIIIEKIKFIVLYGNTGSGKTFTTVSWLLNTGVANGYRILWLVHRQELINQTFNEFVNRIGDLKDYGLKSISIMPVSGSSEHFSMSQMSRQDINICSIYSVASRNGMRFIRRVLGKPGERKLIVVIDEAHHATMPSYKKVLDRIDKINPNRILLGLTATPIRMSDKETIELNRLFKAKGKLDKDKVEYKYVYEIDLAYLIKTGFRSKPYYKYIQTEINGEIEFEISDKDIEHFNRFHELTEELKTKLAKSQSRNEIILKEYLNNKEKYGKTLIFAINQLHAEKLNELFKKAKIKSDYAISNRKDAQEVIRDFKANKFDVLINVQMLTEGTDVPDI